MKLSRVQRVEQRLSHAPPVAMPPVASAPAPVVAHAPSGIPGDLAPMVAMVSGILPDAEVQWLAWDKAAQALRQENTVLFEQLKSRLRHKPKQWDGIAKSITAHRNIADRSTAQLEYNWQRWVQQVLQRELGTKAQEE